MTQRCFFCTATTSGHYTISKVNHSIQPICVDCCSSALSISTFNHTRYLKLASLEEAEEALIRIKLFGEEP
jgi:hypothetical protein